MNNKKINAIMIADTRPALIGNLLVQIKNTNPSLFDVALIYYENISDDDKKIMEGIMPCKFIKFDYELPDEIKRMPSFKKFSSLMFSRYYMFDLLKEYDTITWIDTDVLICGDISSIIDKANKTGMSANFEDPINKSYKYTDTVKTNFINSDEKYDMTRYNMSSGLITVSRKLKNFEKMTKWCFEKTIEYSNNLILPDQGVLNLLIQEFNINVTSVGENGAYCFYPTYKRDSKNAKIVHAWGARKFWKSWYLYNTYPKWNEYYNEWIKMGGTDIFGKIEPEVSIVIPTYKTNVKYFESVLQDLLINQVQESNFQYDNFEIIIVIDGEISDELYELFEEYDDPRIVIINNKEKAGIAKSINIGIKAARGKYIARVDDDDRIDSRRIFKQKQYLDNNKDVHLVSSYFEYFGDLNEGRVTLDGKMCHAWSIFTCPFDHPTIMFRKEFFLNNDLLYDETRSHVEDWELWLRAFEKGMNVGVIPEILYYHRWYNGQAGQNEKTIEMMRDLVKNNFAKLNVNLTKEELVYVSPWQGRVNDKELENLKRIYNKALANNKKRNIYDQKSLEMVFNYRLIEAECGILSPLIINEEQSENTKIVNSQGNVYHKIKRHVLKPFYKPFKRVFYNITSEAVNDNIKSNNNSIFNEINNLKVNIDSSFASVNNIINENNKLTDKTNKMMKKIFDVNKKLGSDIKAIDSNVYELENEQKNIKSDIVTIHDNIYDFRNELKIMNEKFKYDLYFKKKIILIGTSEHGNIGDSAISLGVYEFIRKYFNEYEFVEISTYDFEKQLPFLEQITNNDDIIMLQGGGNLGDKYPNEEKVRQRVITIFPNNKIIILPQTIYFENNKELNTAKSVYNKHDNLLLFARGDNSFEKAKEYFPNVKLQVFLDSALNLKYDYKNERNGIICCIRDLNDESGLDKEKYEDIFKQVKEYDNNYTKTTNVINSNIYRSMRNHEVYKQFELFSQHKLVITDRLHGLIFALITNTPCIVISSYNYKLKENYDMLKDNKYITFIDKDINSLGKAIEKYLNIDVENYRNDYSKEFENMAHIIKEFINEK